MSIELRTLRDNDHRPNTAAAPIAAAALILRGSDSDSNATSSPALSCHGAVVNNNNNAQPIRPCARYKANVNVELLVGADGVSAPPAPRHPLVHPLNRPQPRFRYEPLRFFGRLSFLIHIDEFPSSRVRQEFKSSSFHPLSISVCFRFKVQKNC